MDQEKIYDLCLSFINNATKKEGTRIQIEDLPTFFSCCDFATSFIFLYEHGKDILDEDWQVISSHKNFVNTVNLIRKCPYFINPELN